MAVKVLIETSASQVKMDNGVNVQDKFDSIADKLLPDYSTDDNKKILSIIDGIPTWVTVQTFYTGTADPTSDIGSDGDLYLKTSV